MAVKKSAKKLVKKQHQLKMCLHKNTGQAYVRLNGEFVYLGIYGTPEAEQRFHQVVVLEDQKPTAPVSGMIKEFEGVDGIRFLVWPEAKRPIALGGQHGMMHAKCAVADEDLLFVSSANLTEFALTINLEMGILIRHGYMPGMVVRHFEALAQERTLPAL